MRSSLFAFMMLLVLYTLIACARAPIQYEDRVSLLRVGEDWIVTWTTVGNRAGTLTAKPSTTGSATVSWQCRLVEVEPRTWTIDGPPTVWDDTGSALGALGQRPEGNWTGTIRVVGEGNNRQLQFDVVGPQGQTVPGRTEYPNTGGDAKSWYGY